MTQTPADVAEALVTALKALPSQAQRVEWTAAIAWEN